MSKLEEYKRKKKIERLGLPLMYVVKSTRKGVEMFERQTVDRVPNGLVNSMVNYKYRFDESPYEANIIDGKAYSIEEGHGSGFGDLWKWSYYCTIHKDLADQYAEKELQRITETYLRPHKSIFLIEKGWIDPFENRNAYGYEPFGYRLTEKEAKEFCDSKGFWTADDCWALHFKGNIAKYKYIEIPYCYED